MKAGPKIRYILIGCLLLSACATAPASFRTIPQFDEKLKTTKTITVVPLEIEVCELSVGGIREKIDEWCVQAKNNVMTAIHKELKAKQVLFVKPFHESMLSADQKSNINETSTLFDEVNYSILTHAYGYGEPEDYFPEKSENFDYSLGSEVGKLILGLAASIALRSNLGVQIDMGGTFVVIALVNSDTGSIIWYNQHGTGVSEDLRDPIKATMVVKNVLDDLPI